MRRVYAIIAGLVLVLCSAPVFASVMLDRVVAIVNSEVITWSELYRSMQEDATQQFKSRSEEEKKKIIRENEKNYLEKLINFRLALQEAKSLNIKTSEDELNEAIDAIRKKYSMDEAAFRENLKKEGYTYEEYRNKMRDQITLNKVLAQQIRAKIIISEDDIKKYLQVNPEETEQTEGYHIAQIFLKKASSDDANKVIEEKMNTILDKLKAGESFSTLANMYSEDASRNTGGDLGVVKKQDLAREFLSALSKMKPGSVSSPFWTDNGLHVIMFIEKAETKDRKKITEDVQLKLLNKMFIERYNEWIKGLREKAFIEIRL